MKLPVPMLSKGQKAQDLLKAADDALALVQRRRAEEQRQRMHSRLTREPGVVEWPKGRAEIRMLADSLDDEDPVERAALLRLIQAAVRMDASYAKASELHLDLLLKREQEAALPEPSED